MMRWPLASAIAVLLGAAPAMAQYPLTHILPSGSTSPLPFLPGQVPGSANLNEAFHETVAMATLFGPNWASQSLAQLQIQPSLLPSTITGALATVSTSGLVSSLGGPNGAAQLDSSSTLSANLAEPTDATVTSTLANRFSDTVRPADYGMRCDYRTVSNLTFSQGGSTVSTTQNGGFTQADVGAIVLSPGYEMGTVQGVAPQAYRVITSVSSSGVAMLNDAGTAMGGFTGNSTSTSSLYIGHDDSAAFLSVWAKSQQALRGSEIDLPSRQCLMMSATSVTETVHTLLQGKGLHATTLVYADNGDGMRITDTNNADLVARDFGISKFSNANAGTTFNGDGFYFGNPNELNARSQTGALFAQNIEVDSNYQGDGWNRNFEFENLHNAHRVHLVANGDAVKDVQAADTIYPGGSNQTWGPTAIAGHGTSFFIHGSNGDYSIDSSDEDLVSKDNDVSLDLVNYQGEHLNASHFINGIYAIREMPGYNNDTDEELDVSGNLLQAYNGDFYGTQATQTSLSGNTMWGYSTTWNNVPTWFGVFANGALNQNMSITGNKFAVYPTGGVPVYDCIGGFAHAITGNTVEGAGNITACPSASGGTITGNSGNSVVPMPGSNEKVNANSGGVVGDDGLGGVSVGNGVDIGSLSDSYGGWNGRVYGYVAAGQTMLLTPLGQLPVQGSTTDADTSGAAIGATTVTVASGGGALFVNGGVEELVDTTPSTHIVAVVSSVSGNVLTLAAPLTGAISNGDTIVSEAVPAARIGYSRVLDNGLLSLHHLYCYSQGSPGSIGFTVDLLGQYRYYNVREQNLILEASATTSNGGQVLPSGVTLTLGEEPLFNEPTVQVANTSSSALFCTHGNASEAAGP